MPETTVSEFGDMVRAYRTAAGLTQEDLAEHAGLSARGISDLERGLKQAPHRDTMRRLADAFGLSGADRDRFAHIARRRVAPAPRQQQSPVSSAWRLPVPSTPLIGRSGDVRAITAMLDEPEVRLVTLTGTGGTGKTRLAIEVARNLGAAYGEGVRFASLTTVTDPALVGATISQAIGMQELPGSTPHAIDTPDHDLLVVLDNFEQVLPAATVVGQTLAATRRLTFLVTSRAPLGLSSEREYPVSPFPAPSIEEAVGPEELLAGEAVALFVTRARAVQPSLALTPENLETIARICARLDGLPLAIELAAARAKLLTPSAILARLDRRLPLLTWGATDAPARHQTLRATMAWSNDLLDTDSQRLFRRLAVFSGGFTLQAAATVPAFDHAPPSDIDLLDSIGLLVDRSVLIREDSDGEDEPRFRMLETLREFGLEQLDIHGELDAGQLAHLDWYADLARQAGRELIGDRQRLWLTLLETEHQNMRTALGVAVERRSPLALEMTGALARYWDHHKHLQEGQHWYATVLDVQDRTPTADRAKALWGQGVLAFTAGDFVAAEAILREGVIVARAAGDSYHLAFSVNDLGSVALRTGDLPRARMLFGESLAMMRDLGDRDGTAAVLGNLAYTALHAGDVNEAIERGRESMAIYREFGSDHGQASLLGTLGRALAQACDVDEAEAMLLDGLALSNDLGKYGYVVTCLEGLATIAARRNDPATSARLSGVQDACIATTSIALAPVDAASRARRLAQVEASLGPAAFAAALAEGRGRTPREVLDNARRSTSPDLKSGPPKLADTLPNRPDVAIP